MKSYQQYNTYYDSISSSGFKVDYINVQHATKLNIQYFYCITRLYLKKAIQLSEGLEEMLKAIIYFISSNFVLIG